MPVWQLAAILAQVAQWLAGPPVSLADAAWREAARREAVGPSVGVYSNATLPAEDTTAVTGGGPSGDETALAQAGVDPPAAAEEAAWRRKAGDLADAISQTGVLIEKTQARIATLDREAVSRDDPAQQAELRGEAQDARAALDELQRRLAAAQRALAVLLEEARRLGVPPGWLR